MCRLTDEQQSYSGKIARPRGDTERRGWIGHCGWVAGQKLYKCIDWQAPRCS